MVNAHVADDKLELHSTATIPELSGIPVQQAENSVAGAAVGSHSGFLDEHTSVVFLLKQWVEN